MPNAAVQQRQLRQSNVKYHSAASLAACSCKSPPLWHLARLFGEAGGCLQDDSGGAPDYGPTRACKQAFPKARNRAPSPPDNQKQSHPDKKPMQNRNPSTKWCPRTLGLLFFKNISFYMRLVLLRTPNMYYRCLSCLLSFVYWFCRCFIRVLIRDC